MSNSVPALARTSRLLLSACLALSLAVSGGCKSKKKEGAPPPAGQAGKPAGQAEPGDPGKPSLGDYSFRMKWVPYGNYAGDIVGEKWGIWPKHGINIKVHPAGPGVMSTQMVAGGSDHFGSTGPDELAVAISRGLPLVAIAAEMQVTPIGYIVHPDSGINHPKDFAGKRFKVIPGHNSFFEYLMLIKKFGFERKSVTEIVNKTSFQLWLAKKVDIEPVYVNYHVTQARMRGYPYRVLESPDFDIPNYGNVLFTTKKLAQEKPEVVKAFIRGFFAAWEATWAEPKRAIETLRELDPSLKQKEEEIIAKTIRPYMERTDGRWGWMRKDRWDEQLKAFHEAGFIKKPLKAEDVMDNSFVEAWHGPMKPEDMAKDYREKLLFYKDRVDWNKQGEPAAGEEQKPDDKPAAEPAPAKDDEAEKK